MFLPDMNLTHHWVNHSQNFVNPLFPDIHTNSIEGFWSGMRKKLKRNILKKKFSEVVNF